MNKTEYKIIDNAIDDEAFQQIKTTMLGDSFGWIYTDYVSDKEEKLDNFYFIHLFYKDYQPNSHFFTLLWPLLNVLKAKSLVRIKGNLYIRTKEREIHPFHTDYKEEHKGAIFYLNTNNGLTILEDGTEIKSIGNRLLLFDSSKPHKSASCTDEKYRTNININYF